MVRAVVPDDDGEGPRRPLFRRVADWGVRLGLPLAVFAVVLAVFLSERAAVSHELQIVAPPAAARGARMPIRALLFGGLDGPAVPELRSAPVSVRLLEGERVWAETELTPSVAGGAEGHVTVPADAPDALRIEAVARLDGAPVASVARALPVADERPVAERTGRMAHAVQHFEPGSVEAVGDAIPPHPFEPRVAGGACVPEAPCDVLVHVGDPPASVRLMGHERAEVGPPSTPSETRGLVVLPVTIHGPEGHVVLEARRAGTTVARRPLQLPVALATPAVAIEARAIAPGEAPRVAVEVLGDRPGVILDGYRDGAWAATGSMAPAAGTVEAPIALPEPGLWRLQVRTDPFGAPRAAVRMLAVGDPEAAREAVAALDGDPRAPEGPSDLRFAWAAASVEMGLRVLPPAASGVEADRERLEERQKVLRIAALIAMLLGTIVAGALVLRRGVEAALEAQRVMEATGDPELTSARHRRRTLLSALAIVATLLLAFLGAAALIVARARLLE